MVVAQKRPLTMKGPSSPPPSLSEILRFMCGSAGGLSISAWMQFWDEKWITLTVEVASEDEDDVLFVCLGPGPEATVCQLSDHQSAQAHDHRKQAGYFTVAIDIRLWGSSLCSHEPIFCTPCTVPMTSVCLASCSGEQRTSTELLSAGPSGT